MTNNNVFTFLYDLFFILLEFATIAWEFLFTTHELGIQLFKIGEDFLIDITMPFNIFTLIAGGGFVAFLLLHLVKTFIPVAQKGVLYG